ncbi:MAG: response regulator [Solirubrobacteraceae bacterium]|nr:response regulator [Solirubrobacteraceae bacterium]
MTPHTLNPQAAARSPLVWVLEDSPEDFAILQRALGGPAPVVRLHRWSRAEDALANLEAATELPDLVVADLNLPGIDGAEFLRRVRASPEPLVRALKVCVLSSSGRATDVRRCQEAGATEYLVKPRRSAELRELAEHLLQLSAGHR